jgi:ribosomal protein S18 acetylase RimI-like enzyme
MVESASTHSGQHYGDIRRLEPARDLAQLADLIENAFGEEMSKGGERVLRELRLLARLGPFSVLFANDSETEGILTGFVWEQNGRLVGNVTVNRPTGHPERWQISNVAVLEGYRGQGVGRKLMDAAVDLILRRGGQTAYLFVRSDNDVALHLYRGLGFVRVDEITDLKLVPSSARPARQQAGCLKRLRLRDGEKLYELVSRATGAGQRWLLPIRREQYVYSAGEWIFRQIESWLSGEIEASWGIVREATLDAGVNLCATRLWNRDPYRLKLWVRPDRRGQIEGQLAAGVLDLLSTSSRPAVVSLPSCEDRATAALMAEGFSHVRTLVLMKLDL